MRCEQFRENLDPYLDGELDHVLCHEIESHQENCEDCVGLRGRKESLRRTLKTLPVTPPEEGFLDAIMEETMIDSHRAETRFKATAAVGGAIAAGVVAWLILVLPADLPHDANDDLETVTISMNVERTFRLTFESQRELQAATISIELPPGVEVVGYDDRDSVRWTTTVTPGTNILELPIVVRYGNGGPILARLEHEGRQKTFEFAVEVI